MRIPLRLLTAALPAGGLALAFGFGPEHPARLFRADLTALVVIVSLGAFGVRDRRALWLVPLSALLAAGAHAAVGGGVPGAGVLFALLLGCAAAAFGLTHLACGLGAPHALAPVAAWAVLAIAMSGLFWADHFAAQLPTANRYAFRQAALQLDPATACAYGAARYDRLHDSQVYASVALASSTHRPPTGVPTALLWLTVGVVTAAIGAGLRQPASA